ncbi:MAG: c-type cytochrome [Caldilineaceae bacterium]
MSGGAKKVLKWIAIGLGALVLLAAVVLSVLYGRGTARAEAAHDIAVDVPPVPGDAAAVARGRHLATAILNCSGCHGETLAGAVEFAIPGLLTIPTPNLTAGAGGVGGFYTDEDWVRAVRHGVGHDGRALFIMPSEAFGGLSQADMGALIAYLRSVPPVDSDLPARSIEPLGRVMMGVGMLPPFAAETIDHARPVPPALAEGVTAEYGAYLAATCSECHGAQLSGAPFGPPGEEIMTPNLTTGGPLAGWREEDFLKAIRTGQTPGGRILSDDMPWRAFGRMTDAELQAVWLYLRSLPPVTQGSTS